MTMTDDEWYTYLEFYNERRAEGRLIDPATAEVELWAHKVARPLWSRHGDPRVTP